MKTSFPNCEPPDAQTKEFHRFYNKEMDKNGYYEATMVDGHR